MEYFIKKLVRAKSLKEALSLEAKGEIISVWTEPEKAANLTPAIGFQMDQEDEIYEGSSAKNMDR